MEPTPVVPQNVKHLESTPAAQTASNTLLVIGLVIGIFAVLAIVSYFFFVKTYSAKLEERKENALLYDDPNQKNILGEQITDLPELQIGGNKAMNKQEPLSQQQAMQQQMMQQAAQQQAMQRQQAQAPQKNPEMKPPTPTQTPVPENIYVNNDLGFTIDNQKWSKQPDKTEGAVTTVSYKNDSGSYVLNITFTKTKYSSLEDFFNISPRGHKPQNPTSFGVGGKDGRKSEPFTTESNGVSYKTLGAYVLPKEGDGAIAVELDSTSLDVNDHSQEDVFKKITDSFTFIEKKAP